VIVTLLIQALCFLLARLVVRKLKGKNMCRLFLWVQIVMIVTGAVVVCQSAFIYEDREHYRGQLPFNFIDPNPVDRCGPAA